MLRNEIGFHPKDSLPASSFVKKELLRKKWISGQTGYPRSFGRWNAPSTSAAPPTDSSLATSSIATNSTGAELNVVFPSMVTDTIFKELPTFDKFG